MSLQRFNRSHEHTHRDDGKHKSLHALKFNNLINPLLSKFSHTNTENKLSISQKLQNRILKPKCQDVESRSVGLPDKHVFWGGKVICKQIHSACFVLAQTLKWHCVSTV